MRDQSLNGRRVVILGLARQGTALARFLVQAGAKVTISDLRDGATLAEACAELEGLPIRYVLGEHPVSLLDKTDLLCISGGVPIDAPIVKKARKRGVPLSNDAQLFLERCPAPVIGITGSAGKTTTTTLVGEMCRAAGFRVWVGGNIGNPLIADLDEIQPDDWVVMELSSFQLELMTVSPHIAAVLNITPNHLDRHKTMEAYIAAKRNIVAHQKAQDFALLGYDEPNARGLALETAAQLYWFSGGAEVERGAFRTNGELTLRIEGDDRAIVDRAIVDRAIVDRAIVDRAITDRVICYASDVKLRGRHNLLTVLAASALAGLAGVPVEAMRQVATTFSGVEHRLELVQELDGVSWYDDSIATAPERALAALRSFEEPIVLLAGGRDKDLPWEEFAGEATHRVRQLITFGEAGPMIARTVETHPINGNRRALEGVTQVQTLEEAVEAAARLSRAGDVVLLSPGGTSFDAFRDFAERGDRFKELVRQLATGVDE
jgi:UDP-N-acetylmuramoylalanine--D-glutamate ligase